MATPPPATPPAAGEGGGVRGLIPAWEGSEELGPAPAGEEAGRLGPVPALAVAGLRFRYGPAEPLALDGIDLHLAPGGRLAIVGPSGSGKSTLVHLLLRFWEPTAGEIALAGRDLREYGREDLSRQVAVVSQRTHLFNATIRENLALARLGGVSEAEMISAARQARIHDFVAGLPRGYDTPIGEGGLLLSGGERQRLALARALLQDAPLLVLDEATASLDSLTEREVSLSIREATARTGATTLLVTHRLVGLEDVDEIVVLDAGRVVERGRHAELLRRGGLYARLWWLQAGGSGVARPMPAC